MQKVALSAALFTLLAGCAESLAPVTSQQKSNLNTPLHHYPVVASVAELDADQLSKAIRVDNETVILPRDISNELDNSTIRVNQAINARVRAGVSIKATGESRVVERVYYSAGVVASYTRYEYDAAGIRARKIHYLSAGADAAWFTADDVIENYSQFDILQKQIHAHQISYVGSGPDAVWFTADDVVRFYLADVVDANGAAVAVARFNRPGVDGIWFTADDTIRMITTENAQADGSGEWIQYRSAGPDLDWSTLADNVVGHFALTTVNAAGQEERHAFYTGPGPDAKINTADDAVGFYHRFTYDAQNRRSQTEAFGLGPGADLLWFTADDPVSGCDANEFNTDNTVSKSTDTEPGIDVTCFTADDIVAHYHDYTYDSTGHLLESKSYAAPGVDALWFTADDEVVKVSKFEAK